jgi:quinol monooxygenase YgiN
MSGTPAFVLNGRLDILAANQLGCALHSPIYADPVRPPNAARFVFLDPHATVFASLLEWWRVPETGHLDPQPVIYWPAARLAFDPEADAGPILVTVEFTVAPERESAFLEAMDHLRRSRRRTGASRWELYRDGDRPDRFVEIFSVPSSEEHERQHEGRLTSADRAVEEAALAFSDPPARAEHLLPP